jgi:chromosome partitioning protein
MIIAVVSKKGGVGKTTTTTSLAAAFAEKGQRVLLVDLDPQGSSSLFLGVDRADFAPSIADVLLGNTPAREVVRETSVDNLHLITASADLLHAEQSLGTLRSRERLLSKKLEPLRESYDLILIDCAPSLSLLPVNALVAADHFLIPTHAHFLALEGIQNLLSAIDRANARNASRAKLLGIVLTTVDYRVRVTRDNVARIRESFGDAVCAIEVRTNIRLAEAPEFGQTIFQYAPDSTGANAYRLLADELLMRLGRLEASTPQPEAVAADIGEPTRDPQPRNEPVAPTPLMPQRPSEPAARPELETGSELETHTESEVEEAPVAWPWAVPLTTH